MCQNYGCCRCNGCFDKEAIDIFIDSSNISFEPCIVKATIECQNEIQQLAASFKLEEAATEKQEVEWWENYHNSMKKYDT